MATYDPIFLIDNFMVGKRDHTINRHWHLQRGIMGWGVAYLLFREVLPFPGSSPSATSTPAAPS